MPAPEGLFYAYAVADSTDVAFRYLITFPSHKIADAWWRAITDSVESGHARFSGIRRISPQFYKHDPFSGNITQTVKDDRCAKDFDGKLFFTRLDEREGRTLTLAPVINYTEHLNGASYYIRSSKDPSLYWCHDDRTGYVVCGGDRSVFNIRLVDSPKPQGIMILDSDEIYISLDDGEKISEVGTDEDCNLRISDVPAPFRFSNFKANPFRYIAKNFTWEGPGWSSSTTISVVTTRTLARRPLHSWELVHIE